jgi:GNAT superfamily N-acetyltransferase
MFPKEISIAIDWAAREGWNPGLADASCFACADPGGFLVGEYEGKPAATISIVNYDARFAFLGLYIVRPELRGRGLGYRIWRTAIERAGARSVGLDGVVSQQENYRKSGFVFAHNNIRFGGKAGTTVTPPKTVSLLDIPFDLLLRDDATVFPAARTSFLRSWIFTPGHFGRALIRDGKLAAWGVIRPCRNGSKIGPLVADDRAAAEAVFAALVSGVGGEVYLDAPQPNANAIALAESHGLSPVFETARMYSGPVRPVALHRVYGVTTLELG